MKYLKDPSRAEDMVMEIYEHVAKKLQVHEVEAFKPWLYTVSKNKCYELLRKRNKQTLKEKTAYDVYSEAVFHPDNNDKEDKLTRMESCMETLSDVQKSCISAFYYKSKTYQMIAEEQNLSWNSVRSHIQNGRLKLKKCMEATIKKNV